MKIRITYRSMSTSIGIVRNGDIVDLPDEEVAKIAKVKPRSFEVLPELPMENPVAELKKAPVKRKTWSKKNDKFIN